MKSAAQLVAHVNSKDAIGQMVLRLHGLLGSRAKIFTEKKQSLHVGPLRFGPFHSGLLDPKFSHTSAARGFDITFYHHSIGSPCADRFLDWQSPTKILIYHNITPPELVRDEVRKDCTWGLRQLPSLIEKSQFQIGLSSFTCEALTVLGAKNVVHLPYLLDATALSPSEQSERLLMVGRVEPHKGVREAIASISKIREIKPGARLDVIGNFSKDSTYIKELYSLIETSKLQNSVQLHGRVHGRRLDQFYRKAGVLLCLSRHEGFCVPLVEAMRYQLPIIALNSTAIPETIGGGGILINSSDPDTVATAVVRILGDKKIRNTLIEQQHVELRRFHDQPWRDFLHSVGTKSEATKH